MFCKVKKERILQYLEENNITNSQFCNMCDINIFTLWFILNEKIIHRYIVNIIAETMQIEPKFLIKEIYEIVDGKFKQVEKSEKDKK